MSATASKPKYLKIVEALTDSIQQGIYEPGTRLPSDDELVEQFAASRNTVVRALGQLRDAGAVERIQGAGTFVADTASHDALQCMFVGDGHFRPDSRDSVFGRLELAIDRLLRQRSGATLELDRPLADDPVGHKNRAIDRAIRQEVDGVFFLPLEAREQAAELNVKWLEQLRTAGIAVVLLDQDTDFHCGESVRDLVCLDHQSAGYQVGDHLRAAGAKRILMLGPEVFPPTVEARVRGLEKAVDGQAEVMVLRAGHSHSAIRQAINEFKPDAVVGKDDRSAATVIRVLYQDHIRVPDDILVCGFDDAAIATDLPVMLTSYSQPIEEIAQAALFLMTSRLDRPESLARKITVCGKMVVRASTKRPD
jgi:GntR family transcriptional regulator of arabinose operon